MEKAHLHRFKHTRTHTHTHARARAALRAAARADATHLRLLIVIVHWTGIRLRIRRRVSHQKGTPWKVTRNSHGKLCGRRDRRVRSRLVTLGHVTWSTGKGSDGCL
eukprot:2348942-Pyramimonas_sp.AAC.1